MPHEYARGRSFASLAEPLEITQMRSALVAQGLTPDEISSVMANVIAAHNQMKEQDAR